MPPVITTSPKVVEKLGARPTRLALALKLFTLFAATTFLLGSGVYLVLHAIMPDGDVFGWLPRMFLYHASHPFQYIALVALTYAAISTLCIMRWPHLVGWRRCVAIVGIIIATLLVASVPGGMLWKIHDMQAGYFPKGARFWNALFWGASNGLQFGWLILALSLPYNIIGLIAGYALTHFGFKIAPPKTTSS